MKNILARGGIEFLAVLLGITASLWIDKNQRQSDIEQERISVYEIISNEISQIINYTDERLEYYEKQSAKIDYLFDNWETFNSNEIDDPYKFTYDIWTTGTYMYSPNFSTFDALKSNGQFNLVDKEIRKKFGDLFMLMSYIKKIENNENEAREKLLTYIARNHSEIQYQYSYSNPGTKDKFENFLIVLEKTRFDKTVWSLLNRKCGLTKGRNGRVKWARDILLAIQNELTNSNADKIDTHSVRRGNYFNEVQRVQ